MYIYIEGFVMFCLKFVQFHQFAILSTEKSLQMLAFPAGCLPWANSSCPGLSGMLMGCHQVSTQNIFEHQIPQNHPEIHRNPMV